jgi:hypothetical protein
VQLCGKQAKRRLQMKRTIKAYCFRTEMCGGGTSYDVYFKKSDKPSHPLHGGHIYATTIDRDGGEYFDIVDAIDPRSRWAMEMGIDKYDAGQVLRRKANRLAVRIAKRAFPELRGARSLPLLWASWTLPSMTVKVPVRMALPD